MRICGTSSHLGIFNKLVLFDPRPLKYSERDEACACFDTEDYRTGFKAFLAKQKPEFGGK